MRENRLIASADATRFAELLKLYKSWTVEHFCAIPKRGWWNVITGYQLFAILSKEEKAKEEE